MQGGPEAFVPDLMAPDRPYRTGLRVKGVAAHPGVFECPVIGIPHPHWGAAEGLRPAERGPRGLRRGDHRVPPGAHRALQVPGLDRVRASAEDIDGKTQKFGLRQREWAGQDTHVGGV